MTPAGRLFGGRYRADRPLGEGGFGVVFHATDVNTQRAVALKLLRSTDLGDEASKRFAREARIVQQLTHPNTVRLFDFGSEDDGTQFIVYELLSGETLSHLIRQGPVPPDRTIRIAIQVLKALHEAHLLGVVHRDIKPANIMLLQFSGDRDVVKLLDFGIAKPTTNATHALTNTGVLIGTPRFMSPEQVRGDPIGPPSDLYSLALVLAEMLSGQRVLEGSSMDILLAHISPGRVQLPPIVEVGPLGRVLRRALEKDVRRRYPSALEMIADLEALAGRSSMPQPAEPPTMTGGSDAVTNYLGAQPTDASGQETATRYVGGQETATRYVGGQETATRYVGPHGAGGYPPPTSGGPPAFAPPSRPTRLPWIVAGVSVLALLVVGGAAAGGVWYVSRARAAGPAINNAAPGTFQHALSPEDAKKIARMKTGLRDFDYAAAKSFLVSRGWTWESDMSDEDTMSFNQGRRSFTISIVFHLPPGRAVPAALIYAKKHPTSIFGSTVAFFLVIGENGKYDPASTRYWQAQLVQSLQKHAK